MAKRAKIHPIDPQRRGGVGRLAEVVDGDLLKFIGSGDHHHLAGGRNAKQPTLDPNRRTKKPALDTFLPNQVTTLGTYAGHNASVPHRNNNPSLATLVGTYGIERRNLYAKIGEAPLVAWPGLTATR